MIIGGTLVLPAPDRTVRLARGYVRVEGGTIAEVCETDDEFPIVDIGGDENCLISPGFIDTHLHLPQFDSIGHDGLPLLEWLERVIFPAETRWEDADFAGQMCERVCGQLFSFGTTGIAAYSSVHYNATNVAVEVLAAAKMRAWVGQSLMDRAAPPELTRPAAQLLKEAAMLKGAGRVEPAVTPRFAISCTDELLCGAGELAQKTGAPVQTHLAETIPEMDRVEELYGGVSYVDVYKRAGLLGERSVLGHGIWLGACDRVTIRDTKSVIAHCPTSNVFLQSGTMDLRAHEMVRVRVSLASDVAGGPERSMPRVAKAKIDAIKSLVEPPDLAEVPSGEHCWWRITAGNADALGWHNTGRLEAGADADIVVIEPDILWREHPSSLTALLYAWDDRWVRATLAGGTLVYEA